MDGVVVIGEGEKDEAPMLFNGERVGDGNGPECDVAVDPIDGTRLTALGHGQRPVGARGVAARLDVRPVGRVLHGEAGHRPGGGRRRRHPAARSPRTSAGWRRPSGESPSDVTVVILDRPRHAAMVEEVRATGARIKFITDGDVAGAIMAAREGTGIDLLLGIGGTPEGIIAACAIKTLGGVIQGRLWPADDDERQKAIDAGHDLDRVLVTDELVRGEDVFFVATGITDGEMLKGVRYGGGGTVRTHSIVMRSRSGTIRVVESEHRLDKLQAYSAIDFEHATLGSRRRRPRGRRRPRCPAGPAGSRARPGRRSASEPSDDSSVHCC